MVHHCIIIEEIYERQCTEFVSLSGGLACSGEVSSRFLCVEIGYLNTMSSGYPLHSPHKKHPVNGNSTRDSPLHYHLKPIKSSILSQLIIYNMRSSQKVG